MSENRRRALALVGAGFLAAHAAALICVGAFLLIGGARGAASAGIAAAAVIFFYGVGGGVQVLLADANPMAAMSGTMAGFGVRVALLCAMLGYYVTHRGRIDVDETALIVTFVAVIVGWLAGEIVRFQTLRMPVFDPPRAPDANL